MSIPRFGPPLPAETPFPGLYLLPLDDSFYPPKRIALLPGQRVRIGRQLNNKTTPGEANGVFESRVLSRQHAEAWIEEDKIFIKDVKSSNGTFINGERLSLEGLESEPFELRTDDIVEFGIDIVGEHGEVVHRKVACRITCAFNADHAHAAVRAEQRQCPPSTSGAPSALSPAPPLLPPSANNAHPLFSASPPPHPPRRPQQATGLAGMGGMGSERIRTSGVSFDSILARLHGAPAAPSPPAAAPRAAAPPHPPTAPPPADSAFMAEIAHLRAGLAETQATLAGLPPLPPGPDADDDDDALHHNAHLLRGALAELHAEVADLQARREEAAARAAARAADWIHDVDFGADAELDEGLAVRALQKAPLRDEGARWESRPGGDRKAPTTEPAPPDADARALQETLATLQRTLDELSGTLAAAAREGRTLAGCIASLGERVEAVDAQLVDAVDTRLVGTGDAQLDPPPPSPPSPTRLLASAVEAEAGVNSQAAADEPTADALKAALVQGLAGVQAEWAAFRAAAAGAYRPPPWGGHRMKGEGDGDGDWVRDEGVDGSVGAWTKTPQGVVMDEWTKTEVQWMPGATRSWLGVEGPTPPPPNAWTEGLPKLDGAWGLVTPAASVRHASVSEASARMSVVSETGVSHDDAGVRLQREARAEEKAAGVAGRLLFAGAGVVLAAGVALWRGA